jgi:phosphoglycolate phosphatase-like HAD superfamily hydrolase
VTTDGGATVEPAEERATAPRILVSFDIDGTMEFGDPPGPVSAEVARELVGRGYIVGVASDWPRSSQRPLWSRHGVEPEFVGGKHHLHEVKEQFAADRYVHVGDTEVDERYALLAGFEFLHVEQLELPVVADSIHDAAWTPSA